MRPRQTEQFKSTQRTVRHFQEVSGRRDPRLEECYQYFERLQSHMLIEDVHTQIIPYESFAKKKTFAIELIPESQTVESLVASAFKGRNDYSRGELTTAVADFLRECAQSIVCFGETIYELVYLSRNEEPEKLVAFEFQPVPPLSVKRSGSKFIQNIPPETANRLGVQSSIELPAESILFFELSSFLSSSLL